jgi:hypothetical protein
VALSSPGRSSRDTFGVRASLQPSDPDPEQRLKRLKELLDKGLITNDDYERQRAAILQSI